MSKAAMALGGLALVAGGVGIWQATEASAEAKRVEASFRARPDRTPDLEAALDALGGRVRTLEARVDESRASEESLRARLEAAEAAMEQAGGSSGHPGGGPAEAALRERVSAKIAESGFDPAKKQEWQDLVGKVMGGGGATAEEQERFWKLVKSEGFADGLLKDLESAVEADPKDIDARMELTTGYYTKLFTVPPGPEMGTWAAKAEGQLKEVLKIDDQHWSARNSLATSYSRYPEFLNKTPDAIKEFEVLRKQQESNLAPAPEQANVYVNLGMLYMRQNNKEKAREALESGLRRHPDNAELRKTLDTLGQ